MPDLGQIDEHECVRVTEGTRKQSDVLDIPVQNVYLVRFTDGSLAQEEKGHLEASCIVATAQEILEAYVLSGIKSAEAEFIAALGHNSWFRT